MPPSRKRKTEEVATPMQEDDEEMEEADEPTVDLGSPSPGAKKDMRLRSGRRKRRRSKETTGLTPTEEQKMAKKPKTTTTKKGKPPIAAPAAAVATAIAAEVSFSSSKTKTGTTTDNGTRKTAAKKQQNSRDSLSLTDPQALVVAHGSGVSPSEGSQKDEDGRRLLFDAKPPPRKRASETETTVEHIETSKTPVADLPPPQHASPRLVLSPRAEEILYQVQEYAGEAQSLAASAYHKHTQLAWRFSIILVYLLCSFRMWTTCVGVVDWILPLPQAQTLMTPIQDDADDSSLTVPKSLQQGLANLQKLQQSLEHVAIVTQGQVNGMATTLESLQSRIQGAQPMLEKKLQRLVETEHLVKQTLENTKSDDGNPEAWQEVQAALESEGLRLINFSTIPLWNIADSDDDCPENAQDSETQVDVSQLVTPENLQQRVKVLKRQAQLSVNRLMESSSAETVVREWVRSQMILATEHDPEAAAAIQDMAVSSGSSTLDGNNPEYYEWIQERLEQERADRTGIYDHASFVNGAKVLYGGKRGTSKSLIDSLPLVNRLLQLSGLKFYGYGPEAALVATYPPDALGQCWSFPQLTLKEQLKLKDGSTSRSGDHKRGNFGTLTVLLPNPVQVSSVAIEHPPKGATDQANSAIRQFRIIGYTDALAEGKSWSLGSYEYDIENSQEPIQVFEVATDIFGTPVPPLHAITLAIDSNWGFDYTCLYRFRVHGEAMKA